MLNNIKSAAKKLMTVDKLKLFSPYCPCANYWIPAFLKSDILSSIWTNDSLCSEVMKWDGEPLDRWFKNDSHGIFIGQAFFSDDSISFGNGRHRTRWMIQSGFKDVPVCLTNDGYYQALQYGLLSHRAFDGQVIN